MLSCCAAPEGVKRWHRTREHTHAHAHAHARTYTHTHTHTTHTHTHTPSSPCPWLRFRYFYDMDALYQHLRESHEHCQLCANLGRHHQYFSTRRALSNVWAALPESSREEGGRCVCACAAECVRCCGRLLLQMHSTPVHTRAHAHTHTHTHTHTGKALPGVEALTDA